MTKKKKVDDLDWGGCQRLAAAVLENAVSDLKAGSFLAYRQLDGDLDFYFDVLDINPEIAKRNLKIK